jgi:hypothetical protein
VGVALGVAPGDSVALGEGVPEGVGVPEGRGAMAHRELSPPAPLLTM